MDSSRRAVESYWRSRMIDGATSDEEKVTPVYKLEEICELLRSSHVTIVKEVSEFILKRLDHKSPIVKQKALRLIKYAVGKSGVEFRREMQRHSVAVRQLFHYKGQPDPLKGDALNKAVRDTAHEAISAIFSEQKNKPAPTEDLHRRIQGFGNTNFEMQSEDKKSFISEVVGLGSASIKRGLNSFNQGNSRMKNQNGSYKGPNLHRSLTLESDNTDGYEPIEIGNEAQNWLGISKNAVSGSRNPGVRVVNAEWTNGNSNSSHEESKTREERLVETIVTSGGVRLQPTRDAIQVFLVEAAKLDPLALCQALEAKLNSPQWQVKVRAVCLLDAIVRKKNDGPFSIVASYFSENKEGLIRCSESPQASLREKTSKVLSFLDREQEGNLASGSGKSVKGERTTVVQMPDLINTGDSDYVSGTKNLITKQCDENARSSRRGETPFIYDLLEDDIGSGLSTSEPKTDDDHFADVSFHTCSGQDASVDIFMGMAVDYNNGANGDDSTLFDVFGSSGNISGQENHLDDLNDLMTGLSINGSATDGKLKGDASVAPFESLFSNLRSNPGYQVSDNALNKLVGAQVAAISPDAMPPSGTLPYGIPPSKMFYPAFPSQSINYSAMGNFVAQQQFLAAISNFHFNANITAQNASNNHVDGTNGSQSSPFPDIFQANLPPRAPNVMGNNLKKQETKAFDFISDHLAAARDSKR